MSEIVNKVAQAMMKSGLPDEENFKALARAAVSAIQEDAKDEPLKRKKRQGVEEPSDQINIRAAVTDINKFISWCERNRYSYREGFAQVVKLLDILE